MREESKIEVKHIVIRAMINFDVFTRNMESILGRFNYDVYQEVEHHPQAAEKLLKKMAGKEELMLFNIHDHGNLLNILKAPQKAKQYVIGNPLTAIQMTRHDIRAGLYAPLQLFVYALDDNSIQIDYDLPSSLFGQFHNTDVTNVAKSLDHQLESLIERVRQLSQ